MGKIPKGLSDKAMMQGFEEEATLEDCFLAQEAHEEEKRRRAVNEREADLSRAALTPELLDRLGKELLQLKLDLFSEGVKNYRIDIKREGATIVLAPKETKGR